MPISDVSKVVFSGSLPDIFSVYEDLVISPDKFDYTVLLHRAVGMLRIILTDTEVPGEVDSHSISYTGSKSLNLLTGLGTTNAKQTDTKQIVKGTNTIEFYLLPSPTPYNITLKVFIGSTEVATASIKDVSIKVNEIEGYQGNLFGDSPNFTPITTTFIVDGEWRNINMHEF